MVKLFFFSLVQKEGNFRNLFREKDRFLLLYLVLLHIPSAPLHTHTGNGEGALCQCQQGEGTKENEVDIFWLLLPP